MTDKSGLVSRRDLAVVAVTLPLATIVGGASQFGADVLTVPERLALRRGKSREPIRYPGMRTKISNGREGLANLFGTDRWTRGESRGLLGVDFGHITAPEKMKDMTSLPGWDGKLKRFLVNDALQPNAAAGFSYKQMRLIGGSIDFSRTRPGDLVLEDCYLDARGNVDLLYGIIQNRRTYGRIFLKNCSIIGFKLAELNVFNIDMEDCLLDFSAADLLVGGIADGSIPDPGVRVDVRKTLLRRPANRAHPAYTSSAHADVIQIPNQSYSSMIDVVMYMPASERSKYDEGAAGATASIAIGSAHNSNEVFYINCVLTGGTYSLYLGPAAGGYVYNHMYVGCLWGGRDYWGYGGVNLTGRGGGRYANVGFFGCNTFDGSPLIFGGRALPAKSPPRARDTSGAAIGVQNGWRNPQGIFNYDRALLTPRTAMLLKYVGLEMLDDEIIDPSTLSLNPKYDLGHLVT